LGKVSTFQLDNLSSFLLGSLVTAICAGIPYWLSSRQLLKEANRLAKISNLVTRGMEEAGIPKFNRDASGQAIGLIIELEINDTATSSSSCETNNKAF
jgi:hypothetical protein